MSFKQGYCLTRREIEETIRTALDSDIEIIENLLGTLKTKDKIARTTIMEFKTLLEELKYSKISRGKILLKNLLNEEDSPSTTE